MSAVAFDYVMRIFNSRIKKILVYHTVLSHKISDLFNKTTCFALYSSCLVMILLISYIIFVHIKWDVKE